jgi:hypothetical protein
LGGIKRGVYILKKIQDGFALGWNPLCLRHLPRRGRKQGYITGFMLPSAFGISPGGGENMVNFFFLLLVKFIRIACTGQTLAES